MEGQTTGFQVNDTFKSPFTKRYLLGRRDNTCFGVKTQFTAQEQRNKPQVGRVIKNTGERVFTEPRYITAAGVWVLGSSSPAGEPLRSTRTIAGVRIP